MVRYESHARMETDFGANTRNPRSMGVAGNYATPYAKRGTANRGY